jgi:hypothetical protein
MFNYVWKAGVTNKSVVLRIIDATDGTPELGVVFNTAGIDLQYRREGAASVAITEVTLAALTTAWASGGFLHIGNGYYRLDVPDLALATGSDGVLIHGIVTGMVVIGAYVQLVAYDPFDTVRLGLTALPNAAAEAAGGLYTRGTGAGQINQPANGRIDANVVAVAGTAQTARDLGNALPAAAPGAAGGVFIAGTNAATVVTTSLTTTFTGNLTGSVASVTGAVGSVTGNVGGNVTGSVGSVLGAVGSVTGAVGSVSGNVGGNVTGSVGSLAAQAKTDVNNEVLDVLVTDTFTEPPQGAPGVNISLKDKIGYLFKAFRNRITQTSTTLSIYADDATTVDHKSTVTDDGTTYSRGEISTGP